MKTLSKLLILSLLILGSVSVIANDNMTGSDLCGTERNTDGDKGDQQEAQQAQGQGTATTEESGG